MGRDTVTVLAKCRARGIKEILQRVEVCALVPGDEIVKPGFLQVYGEDKDGYATLSANAGTRFVVIGNIDREIVARVIAGDDIGRVVSQVARVGATVLKVVAV